MCIVLSFVCLLSAVSCGADKQTQGTEQSTTPIIETEPKIELPENKPTDPLKLTFCNTSLNNELISVNDHASYEVYRDRAKGDVLKLTAAKTGSSSAPTVTVDYKRYMSLCGLDGVSIENCKYAVCYIKLSKTYDSRMNITVSGKKADGETVSASGDAAHQQDHYMWQYVLVPLFDGESGAALDQITISYLKGAKAEEIMYLQSINFFDDHLSAVNFMGYDPYGLINAKTHEITVPSISREYTFMHLTDTHLCALNQKDKSTMSASRYSYAYNMRYTYRVGGMLTENKFSAYYKLAKERGAEAVILSGDIITFPSYGNIDLLYRLLNQTPDGIKTTFVVGNHDWTFADDYQSANAASKYLPMLSELSGGDPHFSYLEYDDVIIAMVDNSTNKVTKDTVDKFLALYEKNKPIILSLHVPLYSERLYQYGIDKEGVSYTMGGKSLFGDDPDVKRFYEAVCLDADSPVIAVLSGHLHIDFEESFPNGVPQYVTYPGFDGGCRFFKLKPQD